MVFEPEPDEMRPIVMNRNAEEKDRVLVADKVLKSRFRVSGSLQRLTRSSSMINDDAGGRRTQSQRLVDDFG
jgi:hypothetical protein